MAGYELMFFKSTDQQQDGTDEPDQDGFGDKYDVIIKPGNFAGICVGSRLGEAE